jgi:hypothetical protein
MWMLDTRRRTIRKVNRIEGTCCRYLKMTPCAYWYKARHVTDKITVLVTASELARTLLAIRNLFGINKTTMTLIPWSRVPSEADSRSVFHVNQTFITVLLLRNRVNICEYPVCIYCVWKCFVARQLAVMGYW